MKNKNSPASSSSADCRAFHVSFVWWLMSSHATAAMVDAVTVATRAAASSAAGCSGARGGNSAAVSRSIDAHAATAECVLLRRRLRFDAAAATRAAERFAIAAAAAALRFRRFPAAAAAPFAAGERPTRSTEDDAKGAVRPPR